jgi:hypothetical protein
MSGRLLLTIDLDGPEDYAGIHGVPLCEPFDPGLMYRGPLDRFVELCRSVQAPATLFVVGRDLTAEVARTLRPLLARGFEVASHSMFHDYHLSRRPAAVIADDVRESIATIEQAVGVRPRGFRAPGYHSCATLLDTLEAEGFVYDSSVLPSPTYFALKAAVLATYRLRRRCSTSLLGSPRGTLGPIDPYRPGRDPHAPGDRAIVELPIAVAGPARLPVTGAALCMAPFPLRVLLVRWLAELGTVVVNFHGMDFVDADHDGLPTVLRERQPELRLPLRERLRTLRSLVSGLAAGREVTTCAAAARALASSH